MSGLGSPQNLQQLQQLYSLREKRALAAISEQRVELDRVQARLVVQQTLIKSLKDELIALHQMRSATAINTMSALSLRAESDRRRMLTLDLEMEVFYLSGFVSDVSDAQIELAARRKQWTRIGDQIRGLEQLNDKNNTKSLRSQSRKADALLDDRRTVISQ